MRPPFVKRASFRGALFCSWLLLWPGDTSLGSDSAPPRVRAELETEEDVYTFEPANNGAGPLWCSGSTCLVRIGDRLFASGLETLPAAKPLNNCQWRLWERTTEGWKLRVADRDGRTREPSPLAAFADGRLFLSANPTVVEDPDAYSGPARPEVFEFRIADLDRSPRRLLPVWNGTPRFTEHSYRSLAADGSAGELILFQNIDYAHAEWAFLDRGGSWAARGQLKWPWGAEYDQPQPIRICYPNVALQDRAVYFCGVSDIIEPYREWRDYKRQLTGREWDYDFRRLFFTWTSDITREPFRDWTEIASRDKTCGWIMPGDLYVAPDGSVHVLWTERAVDERLREKFFPDVKQRHALNYAVVRDGKVIRRSTLIEGGEGASGEIPSAGRFQVTPGRRLLVVAYVGGRDANGQALSENRLIDPTSDGQARDGVRLPLRQPFTSFFTATVRAGSPPSDRLELLGLQADAPHTIRYARIRLRPPANAD